MFRKIFFFFELMIEMRKKKGTQTFSVICVFKLGGRTRKLSWRYLRLELKPQGFSREVSQLDPWGHVLPCSLHHAQHVDYSIDGLSEWPCLAPGLNVSGHWATFYSINLPDCCQHFGYHKAVSLGFPQEWCQNPLKLTIKREICWSPLTG